MLNDFEVLDEEEELADKPQAIELQTPQGEVEFRNVSFSYKEDEPLIENMSLKVVKGDSIAIVGPTGAGKTTLVNLLMRFYEIEGGSIFIDGVDIRDIKRNALRGMFGWFFRILGFLTGQSERILPMDVTGINAGNRASCKGCTCGSFYQDTS